MRNPSVLYVFVVMIFSACNFTVRNSDEGMDSTMRSSNVAVDSLFAYESAYRKDSAKEDQMVNRDTVSAIAAEVIDTKEVHPEKVTRFAETLIGVPYRYGSTDPAKGFDCSGFITHVFNYFGISVPRSSIDFTFVGKEIPVTSARRGDLILFTGTDSTERFVGHMGIIVSSADTIKFIHSTSGKAYGVTITPLNKYYQGRFVKTIRVFKQNDGAL